jgi:hypothetical protein
MSADFRSSLEFPHENREGINEANRILTRALLFTISGIGR